MESVLPDIPATYNIVYSAAVAVWAVPEVIGTFLQHSKRGTHKQDRGSYFTVLFGVWGGFYGALVCAFYLPRFAVPAYRPLIFWIGIALILIGVAFRWYSIRVLGRYYSRDVATAEDHQLVETGPYRYIRHPSYTGILLSMLGLGVALVNVGSIVIAFLVGFLGLWYRIHVEERALLDALGNVYGSYMNRTCRLIPFIW